MREIRFKGKTKQGEWVFGDLLQAKRMHVFTHRNHSDKFALIIRHASAYGGRVAISSKKWVLKETLCQYTGLKDKNGVEIYEGDILLSEYCHGMVIFNEGAFWAYWKETKFVTTFAIPTDKKYYEDCDDFDLIEDGSYKVIGNIHNETNL